MTENFITDLVVSEYINGKLTQRNLPRFEAIEFIKAEMERTWYALAVNPVCEFLAGDLNIEEALERISSIEDEGISSETKAEFSALLKDCKVLSKADADKHLIIKLAEYL